MCRDWVTDVAHICVCCGLPSSMVLPIGKMRETHSKKDKYVDRQTEGH